MNRTIIAACIGLAVMGLTLAAQTPQPTTPSQPQTPAATAPARDPGTMTVTGCLKPWSGSMLGRAASETTSPETTGRSASSSDPLYQLTDIDDSTKATMAKPGTPAASTALHSAYLLRAKDASVNLSQHVNHKVQVTGIIAADSSSSVPSAKPTNPESGTPVRDALAAATNRPATLTVSSIVMISATCPTTY